MKKKNAIAFLSSLLILAAPAALVADEFRAIVNLESLTKEFSPGINRFTVSMGGTEAGVVLNVEM